MSRSAHGRPAAPIAVVVAVVAALTACGSDEGSSTSALVTREPAPTLISTSTSTTAAPVSPPSSTTANSTTASITADSDDVAQPPVAVVTDARGAVVTVESTERIIPLDGDVAEIVFALGLGDRVVATDLSATYPPEADALPQIGYQRALDAEPILEFEPTVLLATDIAGPPETLDALERVGIPLAIMPTDPTPDGPARKIVAVADALGVHDVGVELAEHVQAEIDAATAGRPPLATPPRVVVLYLRGPGTQLVLGSDYGIHWLIEAAGGVNVADDLGISESAPITDEAILEAAPDVVLVTTSGLESLGGVEGLIESVPVIGATPAGQSGAILDYDAQLMLGNGPRTGQFLSTLIDDLARSGQTSSGSRAAATPTAPSTPAPSSTQGSP